MASPIPSGTLNIRMYHVGFGDCFLLSFPIGDGHRHVLVDCGAHAKGTLGNLAEVAEHVRATTDQHLAAVVATHRHQDHIWGFERGRDSFRAMTVDEVWLPWVEELGNPEARAVWKKHATARAALEARLALAPLNARRDAVEAVLLNLKPNDVALGELRGRFGAGDGVRYLHGGHPDLVSPVGIEGLTVRVLGPPKDEAFLKKMNPPKAERWGLAVAGSGDGDRPFDSPFDPHWEDSTHGAYWEAEPTGVFNRAERELFKSNLSDALDLAFALEDAVNNSSLALLFVFAGQGLLMPGDAQWGNWNYWIDQQQVATDVFEHVTLYKVGHHGSHNATPRSVIDRLPRDIAVLVPTQTPKPFPTIPEPKLMAALEEHSNHRMVRSDSEGELPSGFERGEFWIDYRVKIS